MNAKLNDPSVLNGDGDTENPNPDTSVINEVGAKRVPRSLASAELMPVPPRIRRDLTKSAAAWLFELATIYREARRGQLPPEVATKLAWVCSQGAKLASELEEARKLVRLQETLDRIERQAEIAPGALVSLAPSQTESANPLIQDADE